MPWSAIAEKTKTIVLDEVNYRGTQSSTCVVDERSTKSDEMCLDADDKPDSHQNLIITFLLIYNVS